MFAGRRASSTGRYLIFVSTARDGVKVVVMQLLAETSNVGVELCKRNHCLLLTSPIENINIDCLCTKHRKCIHLDVVDYPLHLKRLPRSMRKLTDTRRSETNWRFTSEPDGVFVSVSASGCRVAIADR